MDTDFNSHICELIMQYERECAQLMLHASSVMAKVKTGKRDVVTEYDKRIQDMLFEKLSAALPGAKLYGEEQDKRCSMDAEHVFIIDPIDGTMNFVHHMNQSCISVAYAHCGTLCASAIYNPYTDEMYSAIKGGGAYLNGRRVYVDNGALEDTLCLFGTSPYRPDLAERTLKLACLALKKCLDIRRFGSAALDLAYVAAGKSGLYFELNLCPWDFAAGLLMVEEAGGAVYTMEGKPLPFDGTKPTIVAGGRQQVEEFFALIKDNE